MHILVGYMSSQVPKILLGTPSCQLKLSDRRRYCQAWEAPPGHSEGDLHPLHPSWLFLDTVPARCKCAEQPSIPSCSLPARKAETNSQLSGMTQTRIHESLCACPTRLCHCGGVGGGVVCVCMCVFFILLSLAFLISLAIFLEAPSALLFVQIRTLLPHFFP